MSVADVIIITIRILLAPMVAFLPTSISWFSIENWTSFFNSVQANVIEGMSGLGFIFPINLILNLVLLVIVAEISLFSFRAIKWLIQLVRGGGGG